MRISTTKLRRMNNSRLFRHFALFIVFCAEYRCAPKESWPHMIRRFIDRANSVEPCEIMKVKVENMMIENAGEVVSSYANESLTLIVNEHVWKPNAESSDENLSGTRVYHHFEIRSTESDSRSESILTFWSMEIKRFVYFGCTGSKIKLIMALQFHKGIITVNFLNPGDALLFWDYASKNQYRTRTHVNHVLRFETFNRETKEKVEDSPFAVIHKEWSKNLSTTYTISLESHGVTQKLLLIFSAARYTISKIIEDRMGIIVSDEPNMIFILQFSPFESDAAVAFQHELYVRRCRTMSLISDQDLRAFID